MIIKEYANQVKNKTQEFKRNIGGKVVAKFKSNIKKSKLIKTGNLQNSLTTNITETNKIKIVTYLDYAFPVHFGTQKSGGKVRSFKRKTKTGTTTVKAHNRNPLPPKKFMRLGRPFLNKLKLDIQQNIFS